MSRRLVNKVLKPLGLALIEEHAQPSFSQEGEDMVLRKIFEGRRTGFYVDVGAHHPERFSNTCWFYRRGWSGINVDAMPGSMVPFSRLRPRDANVEAAVSSQERELTYYVFNESALNTLDEKLARSRETDTYRIVETRQLRTRTLAAILGEHVPPPGRTIDFMSVDVEGLDLDVLRSNDWGRFRPTCLLVESYGETIEQIMASDLCRFVAQQGYRLYAKTGYTLIFRTETQG